MYCTPSGNPTVFTLVFGLGVSPWLTSWIVVFACESYFSAIDICLIWNVLSLLFPALSSTRNVTVFVVRLIPDNFGTSLTPSWKTILFVALSNFKKLGKLIGTILFTPLPPELSEVSTLIGGNVLSNDVISHSCPSVGVWIVGAMTSFTSSGIVTLSVVPSRYVTVAFIVCVPAFVVLIFPTGVTDFTLLLPLLLIVTAAFKSSFVTVAFWFLTILVPVGSYSSLSLRTSTVTSTKSVDPSGYVTITTPVFSPGPVVVLGIVLQVYFVPVGNPFLLILVSVFGVWP